MTEEQRIEIVKRINRNKAKGAYIPMLEAMIAEQERKPEVKKYLELLKKYQELKKEQQCFDNNEKKLIHTEFMASLEPNGDKKDTIPCDHDIWIYSGSYYISIDRWGEQYIKRENENYRNFSYNLYICLECGEERRVTDWQNFETTHTVLKNQCKKTNPGVHYYRMHYYDLLYKHSVEDARKIFLEKYNADVLKGISRTRNKH